MAKRRGFLAEVHYQAQQAEKRQRQQAAAASRARTAAARQAEQAQRAAERARTAAARANAAERNRLEKEATRLYVESRLAEVESLNATLNQTYAEVDGILAATLDVDDYVDLESLKVTAEHPSPPVLVFPPRPVYAEPPKPTGLFGTKKKHTELIVQAQAAYGQALVWWEQQKAVAQQAHTEREAQYKTECEQREVEAAAHNEKVARLINDLAFDVEDAIQEYVGIVLSNSVYPESFPVEYDHSFDLSTRELALRVTVPPPSAIPTTKEHRYVKTKDEVVESSLAVKAQKDRYASAVSQVAVRTLSEIFEADRSGKIHSISLEVGTETTLPATGQLASIPFVIVAADRDTFTQFDLANVVPQATLDHLGAAMSKSPFDLTPADTSHGVRARKQ